MGLRCPQRTEEGEAKGHPDISSLPQPTSMNSTSGGLVCGRLGGGAAPAVEAMELNSGLILDSVFKFLLMKISSISLNMLKAHEFLIVFGLLDEVRSHNDHLLGSDVTLG